MVAAVVLTVFFAAAAVTEPLLSVSQSPRKT